MTTPGDDPETDALLDRAGLGDPEARTTANLRRPTRMWTAPVIPNNSGMTTPKEFVIISSGANRIASRVS